MASILPRHLRWAAALALTLLVASTGACKRHTAAPDAQRASQDGSVRTGVPAIDAAAISNSTVIADSGDTATTLHQLSLELRRYVIRSRSVPRDFEEFAAKSHVQFPPPPAGKKYAIQGQEVVLVNS